MGRYLNSEAVCNIAISMCRRGRRIVSVGRHIYANINYINVREVWATKLGSFVVALLAFDEAKSEEKLPEWIEQLLEDAMVRKIRSC